VGGFNLDEIHAFILRGVTENGWIGDISLLFRLLDYNHMTMVK
jgi:hypothetical protein